MPHERPDVDPEPSKPSQTPEQQSAERNNPSLPAWKSKLEVGDYDQRPLFEFHLEAKFKISDPFGFVVADADGQSATLGSLEVGLDREGRVCLGTGPMLPLVEWQSCSDRSTSVGVGVGDPFKLSNAQIRLSTNGSLAVDVRVLNVGLSFEALPSAGEGLKKASQDLESAFRTRIEDYIQWTSQGY